MTTAPTKKQMQVIQINIKDKEAKEEMVKSFTGDPTKTSLKDLTFDQANQILKNMGYHPFKQEKKFDDKNPKHRIIMSLLHEIGWKFTSYGKQYADLDRLGKWLMTDKRSPVKKQNLMQMDNKELEKVIAALTGIFKHKAKTNTL